MTAEMEQHHSKSVRTRSQAAEYNEKELILQVIKEHYHQLGLCHSEIKNLKITPLFGGTLNLNFRVTAKNKEFFIKHQIKTSSIYKKSILREFKVLSYLRSVKHCLFVPEPLLFDEGNSILITEYIHGKKPTLTQDVASQLSQSMQTVISVLNNVDVGILQELCTRTRLSPLHFWRQYARHRLRLLQKDALTCSEGSMELCNILFQVENAINERLEQATDYDFEMPDLKSMEKPWWISLVHNDLALRNIIMKTREDQQKTQDFVIIDWEFADAGSIAYDLAFFAAEHQLSLDYVLSFLPQHFTREERATVQRQIVTFMPLIDLINAWFILNRLKEYKSIQDQWLSSASLLDNKTHVSTTKPYWLAMMPHTIDQGLYQSLLRLKQLNNRLGIEYDSNQLFHEAQTILNYFKTKIALY